MPKSPSSEVINSDFEIRHVRARGSLAGGDPRKLKLTKYGDINRAVEYLKSLA